MASRKSSSAFPYHNLALFFTRAHMQRKDHIIANIPTYGWGILLFAVLLISNIVLNHFGLIKFKTEIDLFGIAGIPLFVVTIVELNRTHKIQSADLVRTHISQFISNRDLYDAFYDQIYQYADEQWHAVQAALPENLDRDARPKTSEMRACSWKALEGLNRGKEEGNRVYDPDFFQGSKEEKRLDTVLNFFDILAYNFRNGLISAKDIRGVAGYHLAVIGTREITKYYLKRNVEFWNTLPYQERVGAEPPFENLRLLLVELRKSNILDLADQMQQGIHGEKG